MRGNLVRGNLVLSYLRRGVTVAGSEQPWWLIPTVERVIASIRIK
jgi:hypothetical protein